MISRTFSKNRTTRPLFHVCSVDAFLLFHEYDFSVFVSRFFVLASFSGSDNYFKLLAVCYFSTEKYIFLLSYFVDQRICFGDLSHPKRESYH